MAPTPGENFGPYEFLSPLGEGGMGEVCKNRRYTLAPFRRIKVSKTAFEQCFERDGPAASH